MTGNPPEVYKPGQKICFEVSGVFSEPSLKLEVGGVSIPSSVRATSRGGWEFCFTVPADATKAINGLIQTGTGDYKTFSILRK